MIAQKDTVFQEFYQRQKNIPTNQVGAMHHIIKAQTPINKFSLRHRMAQQKINKGSLVNLL